MNIQSLTQTKTAKLVIAGLLVLAVILAKLHFTQWQKKRQIAREIQTLTEQQQALEQKNKDLGESLAYLTSGDYKERIARQQLNLKKDGEIVYNFNEPQTQEQAQATTAKRGAASRAKEWWLYFFKP